jgi:hypothetical protein
MLGRVAFVDDVDGGSHRTIQHGLPIAKTEKNHLLNSIRFRYFIVICCRFKHPCSQGRSLGKKYVHKMVEQPSVIMLVSNHGAEAKSPALPSRVRLVRSLG